MEVLDTIPTATDVDVADHLLLADLRLELHASLQNAHSAKFPASMGRSTARLFHFVRVAVAVPFAMPSLSAAQEHEVSPKGRSAYRWTHTVVLVGY